MTSAASGVEKGNQPVHNPPATTVVRLPRFLRATSTTGTRFHRQQRLCTERARTLYGSGQGTPPKMETPLGCQFAGEPLGQHEVEGFRRCVIAPFWNPCKGHGRGNEDHPSTAVLLHGAQPKWWARINGARLLMCSIASSESRSLARNSPVVAMPALFTRKTNLQIGCGLLDGWQKIVPRQVDGDDFCFDGVLGSLRLSANLPQPVLSPGDQHEVHADLRRGFEQTLRQFPMAPRCEPTPKGRNAQQEFFIVDLLSNSFLLFRLFFSVCHTCFSLPRQACLRPSGRRWCRPGLHCHPDTECRRSKTGHPSCSATPVPLGADAQDRAFLHVDELAVHEELPSASAMT